MPNSELRAKVAALRAKWSGTGMGWNEAIDEVLALLDAQEAEPEVYPNSNRGLLAMTDKWAEMSKDARLGTLRGIQEAAFRAGRADALLAEVEPAPRAQAQAQAQETWQPDVDLAIQACRDESLSDGACRFAVLNCLVQPEPLEQIDIDWARKVAAIEHEPTPGAEKEPT